ncbi:MAG TPA: penicillin acylase family protein [Vicinamibacterales bacterium]|nr:penicillin acylase family protein [Vicinamibacterales bacterium]
MRKTIILAIGVIVIGLARGTGAVPGADAPKPLAVDGLRDSVDLLRDKWGVHHIYAKNEHDLFFAQGYSAARDRLFQFELWRRQATGTVAEILGRKELKRDIGTRLHMFRGDLKAELNWYHPHGEAIVTAYVEGVNAYIAEARRNPSTLPAEFALLGITPQPWTPEVVISRHNGLLGNIGQELNMAQAVRVLGAAKVKDLNYFQGGDPDITPDPAIDLSLLNSSILDLYNAFRRPIAFGNGPQDEGPTALELSQRVEDIGSNNWVVSGKLTQSGFPLMMNDPHRNQSAPSLRYWVHLVAPGWNVIGGGEPVLPGISIGHNDYGAWGLTIFGSDSEDLYVYDTNPANPNQYKYRGAWEDMRVIKDTIPVKGESPAAVDLKFTRHGPVLSEDAAHHKAYALRAAWMEIGSAPYLASLRMDQAKTWEEFVAACNYSRIPSENMVWADRQGHIGYQAVAITPLRPNWSGLVPVPGDGRYEWNGYLPINALPHSFDPAKGYIATANNYLFPPDYPYKEALHYTGADPYRVSRISEVLGSGTLHTVAGMMRLQNDNVSLPARALVPLLREVSVAADAQKAREALLAWNFSVDADSVAAGIYEMWQRRLTANIRNLLVPKEAQAFIGQPNMKRVIDWLDAPDGRFGADAVKGRDDLVARSLSEAVAELTKKLGADPNGWKWGQPQYHHALIRHQLAAIAPPDLRAKLNVGPYPRGGDSYTVSATGNADNQTSGGSLKIIADTENWDNSLGLNNPGQSGDPSSPHYRDLFELWSRGKYFPIFYTREKVESVTEERTAMTPARAGVTAAR